MHFLKTPLLPEKNKTQPAIVKNALRTVKSNKTALQRYTSVCCAAAAAAQEFLIQIWMHAMPIAKLIAISAMKIQKFAMACV